MTMTRRASSPHTNKKQLPFATWPVALVLCGLAHWAHTALASNETIPSYAIDMGMGLLLVHWWGFRVVPCYLLSAFTLNLGLGYVYSPCEWAFLVMNTAALSLSLWFFHRKPSGKCWMPDLQQSIRFISAGILLPYAVTRLPGLPLMKWLCSEAHASRLFELIQNDLFAVGGALFLITFPGLLLLTGPMKQAGWTRPLGEISQPVVLKKQSGVTGPGWYLPFVACVVLIPLVVPVTTGWYVTLLLPLWAAISQTPVVVALTMTWSLPASFMATRLLHARDTESLHDPMALTAASTGLMVVGFVSFLLSASLQARQKDKQVKKRLNSELKESLKTLVRAFLSSPEATLVSRFSDGKIVDANPVIEDVLGYSRDEMVGIKSETMNLWVHPDQRKHWVESLSRKGGVQAYETELRHKSGEILPCIISARRFPLDGEECIISSLRLNHESKEMKKELERSRTLYREAQKIAHLGHWELDIRTGDLIWSDEIYAIFEVDPITHTPSYALFLNLIHPEDRDMVRNDFNTSVSQHTPYETNHRLRLPDGRIKYIHEKGHTEYNQCGSPLRTIGTVQDVTSYKEMELEKEKTLSQLRQSQKLESVGTLASGIAHDFNNILSAILGYTEISLDPPPEDAQLVENLQQIRDAGNRAKDLVRQLLTFCRKTKQTKEPIRVQPIIREAVKFLRASLPATIRIEESLTSDATIMGDATQIHQVIMNLCTNAAHAMKSDGGVLSIALQEAPVETNYSKRFVDMPSGRYQKLIVEDTGHGMSADTRDRIFDPFFTTKKEGEGSGLGLSVVHGIVSSHDGQILVYSEPGIGTSFTLFFPIVDKTEPDESDEALSFPGGTERLLVVDDEPTLVELMRLMLSSMGYQVTATTCPVKALDLFQTTPDNFDALITDMTMPKMTGLELTEKIRTLRTELPVILCSGLSDSLNRELAARNIRVTPLIKPLDRRTIATALRELLDEKTDKPAP